MQKITSLTVQQRNRRRVNVYLDGEFAFGLSENVAASLQIGQILTPVDIVALTEREGEEAARQRALRFLNHRPRSAAEVRKRLVRAGYEDEVVEKVIRRLQDVDLLNDEAFARYWVEQRETFKPRSRLALRQELQQKGLDRDVIDLALAEVDELAAAQRAVEKRLSRWTGLSADAFRKKLMDFLRRRGFSYEIIRKVTSETWQRVSEESDATM